MVNRINLKYFTFYLQGLPYHPRNVVVVVVVVVVGICCLFSVAINP